MGAGARRGGGGPPGLRGLPAGRGVRAGPGHVGHRGASGWPAAELAGLRVGLLHGQLPPAEKEGVMADFRTGELEVLVATTVIEVGVDVPEATVMVIEDADRFGIAQLHQLRGRVGRGSEPSWCYLLSERDDARGRRAARGHGAAPPTASSWPRSTSSCGARARSWARARRAGAT